jgi:hypothetical protein
MCLRILCSIGCNGNLPFFLFNIVSAGCSKSCCCFRRIVSFDTHHSTQSVRITNPAACLPSATTLFGKR